MDEVVLAYSDLSHVDVMHKASLVQSTGADFRLIGPNATMLRSTKPVVAVCAADRVRQEPDQPADRADPARRRPEDRAGAASDALR